MKSKYNLYNETHSYWHMDEWHRDLMEQPYKYKVFWSFDTPYVLSMEMKKNNHIESTVLYTMRKDDGRAFATLL